MNLMAWKQWPWRWLSAAGVVIGVGAVLTWSFMPQAVEVETARAEVRAFEEVVEDDGRARVRERLAVTMPWTGALERPALKEGHTVSSDESLFWVRPAQPVLLDARTRAELQARTAVRRGRGSFGDAGRAVLRVPFAGGDGRFGPSA